jgi:sorting nexin-29
VENVIGDYQSGFRQGRSTVDQIYTVRQILEKSNEFCIETHQLFIDFKAAYDSVDRSNLYIAMKRLQIPKKLIALVLTTLKTQSARLKFKTTCAMQ